MNELGITSQITFLYFQGLEAPVQFFTSDLGLELVFDPGWAKVWRTGQGAYVGAVLASEGSIPVTQRGGFLVSLTVRDVESARARLLATGKYDLSAVKMVGDIGLKSFFFKGPEGYDFEIQEFVDERLRELF